jgi:hypothetical protein
MPDAVPEVEKADARLRLWAMIVCSFAVASCVQIFFYGAPTLLGFGAYNLPGWLYQPAVLSFLFVPAALALLFSLNRLRAAGLHVGRSLSAWPIVTVSLLAILSAYLGVYVSFNTWGT